MRGKVVMVIIEGRTEIRDDKWKGASEGGGGWGGEGKVGLLGQGREGQGAKAG